MAQTDNVTDGNLLSNLRALFTPNLIRKWMPSQLKIEMKSYLSSKGAVVICYRTLVGYNLRGLKVDGARYFPYSMISLGTYCAVQSLINLPHNIFMGLSFSSLQVCYGHGTSVSMSAAALLWARLLPAYLKERRKVKVARESEIPVEGGEMTLSSVLFLSTRSQQRQMLQHFRQCHILISIS